MSDPKVYRTRRKFLLGSLILGFTGLFKITPLQAESSKQPINEETVQMITADGKLVAVPKEVLKRSEKFQPVDKDLKDFKNTDRLHRSKIQHTNS